MVNDSTNFLPSGRKITHLKKAAPFALAFLNISKSATQWPPRVEALGIMATNVCGAKCDHCFNNSSPDGQEALDVDEIEILVKKLMTDKHPLKVVGISGGEPFMYKDLPRLVGMLKSYGVLVTITSGGTGIVDRKIAEVANAGLDGLVLSIDKYHMPYINIERIIPLLKRSIELGIKVKINYGKGEDVDSDINWLDQLLPQQVDIDIHPIFSIGRAISNDIDSTPQKISNKDYACDNCATDFNSMALNYDGFLYPCCSVGGFTEGLRMGHLSDLKDGVNLDDIYRKNELLAKLHRKGWDNNKGLETNLNKCEICYSLAKN